MNWRETGTPCLLCGAARSCRHSTVEPPRLLADIIPEKPDGRLTKISGGGRYKDRTARRNWKSKTV